jgi:hypothetical protein
VDAIAARRGFAARFVDAGVYLSRGLLRTPQPWLTWLCILVAVNVVVPLAAFPMRYEAHVVAATFVVGALLMTLLTMATGFSRLLGLAHVVWVPLLYYLGQRSTLIPGDDGYGVWLRLVIVADAISLAIDATDVIRYVAGERADLRAP